MDDAIEKLVPRDRPDECNPERCGHACNNPTEECYAYRIEWCRKMLRDFEDGFLVVQGNLSNIAKDNSDALIRIDGLLLSINNMLEMVKLSAMILRGDYRDAEKAVDKVVSDELQLNMGLDEEDDDSEE